MNHRLNRSIAKHYEQDLTSRVYWLIASDHVIKKHYTNAYAAILHKDLTKPRVSLLLNCYIKSVTGLSAAPKLINDLKRYINEP